MLNTYKEKSNFYIKKIKNYFILFNLIQNSKVIVINKNVKSLIDQLDNGKKISDFNDNEKNVLNKLLKANIIADNGGKEKAKAKKSAKNRNLFSIWLQLTDKCNFNCPYCEFGEKTADLDLITFKKNIENLYNQTKEQGCSGINIKLTGGEPMLELTLLEEVINLTQKIDPKYFNYSIITNGSLVNDKIIEIIKKYKIGLSISMDGIYDVHNKTRSFKNGAPSFEIIMKNIKKLRDNGLSPFILTVISKNNIKHITEIFDFYCKNKLGFRFNLVREVYENKKELEKDNKLFTEGFLKLFRHIRKNLPEKSITDFFRLGNIPFDFRKNKHCAILGSFMGMHNNGKIYTCVEGMSEEFEIESRDGLLKIKDTGYGYDNLTVDKIAECSDCEWKYLCAGGCPTIKYKNFKRFDVPSIRCSFYKKVIPGFIDLVGYQLYVKDREKKKLIK